MPPREVIGQPPDRSEGDLQTNALTSLDIAASTVESTDTTGAGDVFAGTLAARLGAGVPLPQAVPPAVAAASHATTYPGAQGWTFE